MNASNEPVATPAFRSLPTPPAAVQATSGATATPDLERYTDASFMRDALQRAVPGFADGALHIERLEVRQARRDISRRGQPSPLVVCYALQVHDRRRNIRGTQLLCGQVFRQLSPEHLALHAPGAALAAPAFGPAMACVPDLHLVLWALPNDPALPQLATLLAPERLAGVLPWDALGTSRDAIAAIEVTLLRYDPQRRATLRCTLTPRDGGAPRVVYAKTFLDDQGRDLQARFAHVWSLEAAGAPRVARPLGWSAATRSFWQAEAKGTPLLEALAGAQAGQAIARAARALACLHEAPLALAGGGEPHTVAYWLEGMRRRHKKFGRMDAALAQRVAGIVEAVRAHAGHVARRPAALIHGDWHPDQAWVHEGRIVLFDFDEFTLGDPMEDLAAFLLKLARTGCDPALGDHFVAAYAERAPARFDRAALDWHFAVQSLVQAFRAHVFQCVGWQEELERRLAVCEGFAAALNQENRS